MIDEKSFLSEFRPLLGFISGSLQVFLFISFLVESSFPRPRDRSDIAVALRRVKLTLTKSEITFITAAAKVTKTTGANRVI